MNCAAEEWKPVLGYEGLYEVSNMGRVRALFCTTNFHKPNRILKPWLLKTGYLQVHLMRPGEKRKAVYVHTLVLQAFVGPAPEKCEARHLNAARSDNVITNLAWGTHKENAQDMLKHGHCCTGEKQWNSKLTSNEVMRIRALASSGMSLPKIVDMCGVTYHNAWAIINLKSWRHLEI